MSTILRLFSVAILGASAIAACGGGMEGSTDSEVGEPEVAQSKEALAAASAASDRAQQVLAEVEAFRGDAFTGPVKLAEPARALAAPEGITGGGSMSSSYDPEAAARGAAFLAAKKVLQ